MMELLSLSISVYLRVFMRCVACACIRGVCRAVRARVCGVCVACVRVWRVCDMYVCVRVHTCVYACMHMYMHVCMRLFRVVK